jgi:hypothetical protein
MNNFFLICNHVAYQRHTFAKNKKNERVMANIDELKRLGERFPNKNVGCGNPDAKILVVTQKEGNEDVDFEYLKALFRDLPDAGCENVDVLKFCYYVVFDEELLKDSFFEHFQVIQYIFPDGSYIITQQRFLEWIGYLNVPL